MILVHRCSCRPRDFWSSRKNFDPRVPKISSSFLEPLEDVTPRLSLLEKLYRGYEALSFPENDSPRRLKISKNFTTNEDTLHSEKRP
jgi:hypothetical protein